MDRFSKFNPKATFLFFICILILNLVLFNPLYLAIILFGALSYKFILDGKKTFAYIFKFILPLIVLVGVFNFVFAHYGDTILFSVKNTDFTLEPFVYGLCQGLLFAGVVAWFSLYGQVITSERFLAVFGRIAPNTSLLFSMVLSFIPRFKKNMIQINDARLNIKTENKMKKSLSNFSALITMTLEESIETADSMKARGFNGKRSAYSKYRFMPLDAVLIIAASVCTIALCIFKSLGKTDFYCDPVIEFAKISPLCVFISALISFLPVIIDFEEGLRWKYLKRKI